MCNDVVFYAMLIQDKPENDTDIDASLTWIPDLKWLKVCVLGHCVSPGFALGSNFYTGHLVMTQYKFRNKTQNKLLKI